MGLTNLNRREQILVCIVILLAFGLLYKILISPELKRINAARFQANSQRELLGARADKTMLRNRLNKRFRELETTMTDMAKHLFSRNEAMDFLRALPRLASRTGSKLVTIIPKDIEILSPDIAVESKPGQKHHIQELKPENSYVRMPIQISINGKYSEIISFFELLEKHEQLLAITEIDIETSTEDQIEVDAELMLNLYVMEVTENSFYRNSSK